MLCPTTYSNNKLDPARSNACKTVSQVDEKISLQLSTLGFFDLVKQIFPTMLLPVSLALRQEMGRLCCRAFLQRMESSFECGAIS